MFSLLLRGFVLGFAVAASPGPIFFLCVRRTLVRGRLYGLFSGFGVSSVDAFYAAVASLGVAALASAFAGVRRPLELIGGAVLIALGVRVALGRARGLDAPARATAGGLALAYASTVALTITNPATIVSFAALAATFGLGTAGSWTRPAAVVAGVLIGSTTWWCVLVAGVSVVRARLTPPVVRGLSAASGVAIAILGAFAIVSTFFR